MPARILGVEDNPTILEAMTFLLRACADAAYSSYPGTEPRRRADA
jgi:hypothetical protein